MNRLIASRRTAVSVIRSRHQFVAPVAVRQGSTHAAPAAGEEVYPDEGFNKPHWRYLSLATLALLLYYRVTPASSSSSEESTSPITKWLTPQTETWKANAEKHLTLAKEAADDKLLFQEAERPKVRRLRYLGTFSQASPNNIPVGSQADLSDLVIKSEKDDFSFGKEEATEE
ncbi:hypothetical protein T439DRAFT_327650 [Meredithblackwellia eburnea MCA 4105]